MILQTKKQVAGGLLIALITLVDARESSISRLDLLSLTSMGHSVIMLVRLLPGASFSTATRRSGVLTGVLIGRLRGRSRIG